MSPLSSVPMQRRHRAAATAGLFAALLVAVGVVPWVGEAPAALRVLSTISLVVALLFALVAWGLLSSVRAEVAEASVDAAIMQATGGCDCGHDHDPDELHITDAPRPPVGS